jgi:hypothetical protein
MTLLGCGGVVVMVVVVVGWFVVVDWVPSARLPVMLLLLLLLLVVVVDGVGGWVVRVFRWRMGLCVAWVWVGVCCPISGAAVVVCVNQCPR